MDMTTEPAGELKVVDPDAYRELEKRLEKTEKKLEKAKERAQTTMKEIWQLDVQLKEQEERAKAAEDRLAELAGSQAGLTGEVSSSDGDELRIALHEAEERAKEAESKLSELGSSASLFQQQLDAIQGKFREAEERALEWEERFHRSEEKMLQVQQSTAPADEVDALRAQLGELNDLLAETSQQKAQAEQAASRQERVRQALEEELVEVKSEFSAWQKRTAELERQLGEAGNPEVLEQVKERLHLSEEKASLYQYKAEQAQERLGQLEQEFKQAQGEQQELKNRLLRSEALLADAEEKLRQRPAQGAVQDYAGADERVQEMEQQLKEALQRSRDSELKANQIQVKLQKAIHTLKEYEQRANESDRETQRLAFQDTLTGLPNLNLIRQYLEFTVKQVQRFGRASALLIVDLDRFKLINDAMGLKAGDELLKMVAERLQTAIRESDALGRRGEDEFLILLSELFTGDDSVPAQQKTDMIRQNIAIVVNRISEALSRPFQIQGQKFYIRASIGVSICPNDASSAQEMIEHADSAMYQAKESGRGRCIFYNTELHRRQERRLAMDSQLRLAMEKNEFVLLYQPILEVKKGKGTVVGVEALLRWNHRVEGLLPPAMFLEAAEETGLIVALGQWVCRQACWQLRQWLGMGANLFVSVNISTRQMLQADLTETIVGSIEEFGLQPGLLFVELAEGGNVDEVDLIERTTASLGRAGIRVAIDDFGIGYSSLSRLDLQHVQFLKIDPSLVAGTQNDQAKAAICEAAVRLAVSLGLKPLAEGVETSAQARHLVKLGCEFLQGFYFQEPCSAEEMTKLLAERRVWKF